MRKRVYLYIVKNSDILVLRRTDFPDLGLQIPGGTVKPDEMPIDAAARDAIEETGLAELGTSVILGATVVPSLRSDEDLLEAWFYRIDVKGQVPEVWLHTEYHVSDNDNNDKIRFELSWLPMTKATKFLGEADCLMLAAALCTPIE